MTDNMIHFKRVYLTHANLKRKLHLIAGTISGYHHSDATHSTHVYTTGGIFPAAETPDEIDKIIDDLTKQPSGQGANKDGK